MTSVFGRYPKRKGIVSSVIIPIAIIDSTKLRFMSTKEMKRTNIQKISYGYNYT